MKTLVTGGAGLIGSHIVDALLAQGHEVKILDNLEKPTHLKGKPDWIPQDAEFILGDMRNESDVRRALAGVEVIFHEAAAGGFTPELSKYVAVNSLGTACMLEMIAEEGLPIHKIIVASSIAVYGEGKYQCPTHGVVFPGPRPVEQLEKGAWETQCPACGVDLAPMLTDEDKPVSPEKPYSVTKYAQERLTLGFGKEHGIPAVALRYFVTYGPRQSLFNPYSGVCSIFSTRLLNNLPPVIYEDGLQTRDFVFVKDVARANLLVMESDAANYRVFNVGTGQATTILSLAQQLVSAYDRSIPPQIEGEFRPGEVRHIIADIGRLKALGFEPRYSLKDGLRKYIEWIETQGSIEEYFSEAEKLLKQSGVIRSVRRTGASS